MAEVPDVRAAVDRAGAARAVSQAARAGGGTAGGGRRAAERGARPRGGAAEGYRRLLGGQHPDTLDAVGSLGRLLFRMGDHAAAAPALEEAVEGLSALEVGGRDLQHLDRFKRMLQDNARYLADPTAAAELQREARQHRLEVEASLPTAAATVVGVQSRPELNGAEVTTRRFLIDKGR